MSKNVVFIVNLEETKRQGRNTPYHFSVNAWTKWCKINNCELFILTNRVYPEDYMNANWHKIYALSLLDANEIDYDQVLIVDADTIPHPDSPNVFELTGHKFCAVHNYGSYDWVCRSIENYKKHLFPDVELGLYDYFNSGVIICNKAHREFYETVQKFYNNNANAICNMQQTFGVGTDQPVLNYMIQQENVDYKQLPYEWNMQDMARFEVLDQDLTFTKIGWLYHFNAIPNNHNGQWTNHFMQLTYNTLYGDK